MKLTIRPPIAGLIQAAGIFCVGLLAFASATYIGQFLYDPFSALLVFSVFAVGNLLIVIVYPFHLLGMGKRREALAVFAWTFLWMLAAAVVWIVTLAPYVSRSLPGFID